MAEQRQVNKKPTKRTIDNLRKKKLAGYDEANKVPRVLIQEGYLCPCPAAMSTHLLSPVIRKLDSLGQEGSKVV